MSNWQPMSIWRPFMRCILWAKWRKVAVAQRGHSHWAKIQVIGYSVGQNQQYHLSLLLVAVEQIYKIQWFFGAWTTESNNYFLANVKFAICCRPSVCRLSVCLSSVTFGRPTQAVQIFGNISTALGTLAIHWRPLKISRRSSKGNPSAGGVKHKRGSEVQRFRTYRRLSRKRCKIGVS